MKKTFVKAVAINLVLILRLGSVEATTLENTRDTSRKLLLASNNNTERVVLLKAANIIYPDLLTGNEEESLDYIEQFSAKKKDYLVTTYNRSRKIFPRVEAILKKYNVPVEFKVLLALESGFNANAVSSAGAVGYWQFMDVVAKEYGLKIPAKTTGKKTKAGNNRHRDKKAMSTADDRKNFNKSTIAAARYLLDRSRNLDNNWLLIAASYNCGVGNVWNAMERSGKKSPTFWDIKNYLPAETRAYVMNFIALNVIFHNYEAFTKNDLCFRDITCKAAMLNEHADEILPSSIVE